MQARSPLRGAYRVRPSKDGEVILLTREALKVQYLAMQIEKIGNWSLSMQRALVLVKYWIEAHDRVE